MVEARVDQLRVTTGSPKSCGDLGVGPAVGAETVAGQHDRADDEQVALALVDVPGVRWGRSRGGQPVGVGRGLAGALRVGEAGDDGLPSTIRPPLAA